MKERQIGLEAKAEKTKYRFADAMKTCMRKISLEKITVKEIVEVSESTRQTFYHHFKDKYDLINWYFDKILLESFEHMGEGKTIYEALVNKFYYIQKEKLFFKAAFRTDEQNCLKQHDFELIFDFYSRRIESNTGQPVSEHLGFFLEMYCYGSIYMMVQWVLGKQNSTPEDMAKLLVDAMPYDICETFKKLNLL